MSLGEREKMRGLIAMFKTGALGLGLGKSLSLYLSIIDNNSV